MIRLLHKLPKKLYVACSGGSDSMAALDFLSRNHTIVVLHVNHASDNSDLAENFVQEYCQSKGFELKVHKIQNEKPSSKSQEEFWRDERYDFFRLFKDAEVVTGHNLDDVVETWIWSSLNGEGKIIPYRNQNVIRPFLANKKEKLVEWCLSKNVPWIEDTSNKDMKYVRNHIRHQMMPDVLKVNPGIHKVICKKVEQLTDK